MGQQAGLTYQNPLDYTGPTVNLISIKAFKRIPVTTDVKYKIGSLAIIGKDPISGTEGNLYYLSKFNSSGEAQWLQLTTGIATPGVDKLTTDDGAPAVIPDISRNINILGGTGIVTSGQDPATTVTISVDTAVITTEFDGDTGSATPTLGVTNMTGGTGITTSATGNTVTFAADTSVLTTEYDGDTGSATPTAGVINLVGGSGVSTVAAGNTITFTASATTPLSFDTDSGSATPALNTITIAGGTNVSTSGAGATVTINANTGAQVINVTLIDDTDSPYSTVSDDYYISCDVSVGGITVRLPNAPTTGRVYVVKDSSGNAAANNIIVTTVGGIVNIDGAASFTMNTDYEAINLLFNGTSYEIY